MNNKIIILGNLPGVNKDVFPQSCNKHYAAINSMDENELIEVIDIYDKSGISYVKDSGIVDFQSLARTKEEALRISDSNVISLESFLETEKGRAM